MAKRPEKKTPPRIIRDQAFADRLASACDGQGLIPAYNYGRLTWIHQKMSEWYDIDVSLETVRKWFSGEARPRPQRMKKLAELLKVDEAWLSLGITPEMEPTERQAYNAIAPGAVNLVAGLIQLSGGHPAFPEGKRSENCNLLAIIKGKSYAFYITLGIEDGSNYTFNFPVETEDVIVIGVVPVGQLRYDFLYFSPDGLESAATNRGGYMELVVKKDGTEYTTKRVQWERVRSFKDKIE